MNADAAPAPDDDRPDDDPDVLVWAARMRAALAAPSESSDLFAAELREQARDYLDVIAAIRREVATTRLAGLASGEDAEAWASGFRQGHLAASEAVERAIASAHLRSAPASREAGLDAERLARLLDHLWNDTVVEGQDAPFEVHVRDLFRDDDPMADDIDAALEAARLAAASATEE